MACDPKRSVRHRHTDPSLGNNGSLMGNKRRNKINAPVKIHQWTLLHRKKNIPTAFMNKTLGGGGDHMVFRWNERSGDLSSLKGYGGTMENWLPLTANGGWGGGERGHNNITKPYGGSTKILRPPSLSSSPAINNNRSLSSLICVHYVLINQQ